MERNGTTRRRNYTSHPPCQINIHTLLKEDFRHDLPEVFFYFIFLPSHQLLKKGCIFNHKIYNIKIEPITEGGPFMTVATQVKQTISGLKSAQASLEQFALETENQQAKQLFQTAAQQTQTVVDSIEPRMTQIEQEEPQYKQQ